MNTTTLFTTLGLEPGVPSAEIKRAYRNLSLKLHPDASRNPATASRFNAVTKAYENLAVRYTENNNKNLQKKLPELEGLDLFALGSVLETSCDNEKKRVAARKLGLSGCRSAWIFLRKGLQDKDDSVVESCIRAASVLGLAQGGAEIASTYERASPSLRNSILEIAKVSCDNLFCTALEVAKFDNDPKRRVLAFSILKQIKNINNFS